MFEERATIKQGNMQSAETKIKALERVVNAILGSDKISYASWRGDEIFEIVFEDIDPTEVRFRGFSEGLEMSYEAQEYIDKFLQELYTENEDVEIEESPARFVRARIDAHVYMGLNPWGKIEELEEELKNVRDELSKLRSTSVVQ